MEELFIYPSAYFRPQSVIAQLDKCTAARKNHQCKLNITNTSAPAAENERWLQLQTQIVTGSKATDIICIIGILTDIAEHKTELELIYDLDPGVPNHLRGDARHLRQIIYNLVDNAIKFTEKGEIIIKMECREKTENGVNLQFSVVNSGIGMDTPQKQLLFAPFTQIAGSVSRKFGGTGLGLTICQHLVKLRQH